ncbi:MAG: hypothetical protein Q8L01_01320, partial [Candidatus Woesebacteria bacterium]|nr:hypothetical protein [Candidatus Woesebacteria bacterium]
MKKIIKIISYVLIVVFFSIALSGCTKKTAVDPNANKIIVWSFEDEDVWKGVAKEFEKKNSGYKLVYVKQTLDLKYENRVLNSILSGAGPDVWAMPNDWIYRHKDKLIAMPDKLVKTTDLNGSFVPAISQSVFI